MPQRIVTPSIIPSTKSRVSTINFTCATAIPLRFAEDLTALSDKRDVVINRLTEIICRGGVDGPNPQHRTAQLALGLELGRNYNPYLLFSQVHETPELPTKH